LARPVDAIRLAGVDRVTAQRTAWVARLAGARDLAIGAGLLDAMRRGQPTGGWQAAGVLSDAMDAVIIGSATVRGQLSVLPGAATTACAIGGVLASAPIAVDRKPGEPTETQA
jgi:peptide-methionine (R)-S-oxide reductase